MNHQVQPVTDFVIIDDAIRQKLFSGDVTIPAGKKINLTVNTAKNVADKISVKNWADVPATLTPLDSAIFDAVISEWLAGNELTTPARIYKILGGTKTKQIPAAMEDTIRDCLDKMSQITVLFNPSKDAQKRYRKQLASSYYNYILQLSKVDASINGRAVHAIEITGSVLYDIADDKNQIKRASQKFFNVDIRHSKQNIVLLHYLIRRVAEIVGSNNTADSGKKCRRLHPSILLARLYSDCGFDNCPRWQLQDIRAVATKILDALVKSHLLVNWEIDSDDDAPQKAAIRIILPRKLCENLY